MFVFSHSIMCQKYFYSHLNDMSDNCSIGFFEDKRGLGNVVVTVKIAAMRKHMLRRVINVKRGL